MIAESTMEMLEREMLNRNNITNLINVELKHHPILNNLVSDHLGILQPFLIAFIFMSMVI